MTSAWRDGTVGQGMFVVTEAFSNATQNSTEMVFILTQLFPEELLGPGLVYKGE